MTPGGRLAAAIEIAERLGRESLAADRALLEWGRSHRFAGAKDRRAIAELLYGFLRDQGALRWRLGDQASPRLLVIAAAGPDATALCTGTGHDPAPLSADDLTALTRDPGAPPDWAVHNYPEWLDALLKERFGADFAAAMAALNARAPVDLRINRLKGSRDDIAARLADAGIAAAPTTRSPLGLRLAGHDRLDDHPLYRDGFIEPQDEAAQLCTLLVGAARGMQVVDLCAGAGGKTLGLAADMANTGQIYAADRDGRRLERLMQRAQRAGARNIQTHRLTGPDDPWAVELAGRADRVLVDAPCSGTGTWRRNPESRWRLSPDQVARYQATQDQLLDQGAALVRPGGRLIYATCSLLTAENEQRVADFLARHSDFAVLPVPTLWSADWGPCPTDAPMLALSPHAHGTDGFFVAVLARRA